MRNKRCVLLIAGVISVLSCFTAYAGAWEQDGEDWKYKKDNGSYAEYEWVQDSGDWYYCSRWGVMQKNTVIDGYYLGADGKMISASDTENPLYGEKVYSNCYMQINSYKDCGTYYKAQVTLYDSSYYSNDELQYNIGDKFLIRPKNVYGTVSDVQMDTSGDMWVTVKYGMDTYEFSKDAALYFPYDQEEQVLSRKIKETEVFLAKDVVIVPVKGYQADTVHKVTLERYLNENWSRMIPVFEGKNVRMLYDNIVNYAD